MKLKIFLLISLLSTFVVTFGQTKNFKIHNHQFVIKTKKVNNEWETKNIVKEVYIKENGNEKLILTYFAYKDEGGDSNNLFWYKESLKVKSNTIIITTHHFQKTGLDPITEWEKKTFIVSRNGEVEVTEHLFKKYGSNEWKIEEEWYKK